MKKLISALLVGALTVGAAAMPVGAASSSWRSDGDITALLSGLDIMVGDDDGNFDLDAYVTRAEMSKIAVAASSYKNTVALGLSFSPFSDVPANFWGAPYIRAAVSAGLVKGYIDGNFKPNGAVTYEEAITIMLRVLGYTEDDFGASYPYGQIGMAESLKMTDGMNSAIGQPLTRRQVAILVCNSLDTSMKGAGAQDLISVHDCSVIEDVTIIAGQGEDSTLSADEISTTSGKYRINESFDDSCIGCRGDMVVKDGKYLVAFSADGTMSSEKYVVYSILNDAILCYPEGNNTSIKQIEISGSTTCYKGSNSYTYASLSSSMEMGDTIRIRYKDNGEVDYINYNEGTLEGPIKVSSDSWMSSFDTNSSTKIVRAGKQVTADSIEKNDIIYYSADLNMVLAYTTKVTGIYESASPSKDLPQSVTISGVSYEVEGVEAFNELSSSGSVNYGDTVTALLGKDGKKIAGVVSGNSASTGEIVGYVSGTGKKTFTNSDGTTYTSYYAEIASADGTVYTYPTATDRSSLESNVVRARISNGQATLGTVSSGSLSGYVSYSDMTIGGMKVSEDIKILDVAYANSSVPLYTKTYMQRIDGINLSSSNVKYYKTNSSNEITELILQNVTGDMYSYGIKVSGGIDIDNNVYSYSGISNGSGIQAVMSGNSVKTATKLSNYSSAVEELTDSYAVIGGNRYLLSDKVKVYTKVDNKYMLTTVGEINSGDYGYTCYYDKAEANGGRIRIIVAVKK